MVEATKRTASKAKRPDSRRNTTADRAIDVLLLFNEERPVLLASEISDELSMSRSTTYRYLQTLRSYGFLDEVDNRGGFRLGPRVFRLARIARQSMSLVELALPFMHEIGSATHETVLLTRRSGNQVICLERVESSHPVRISYERGHALPIHAGAQAKCELAFETSDNIDQILGDTELQRFTDATTVAPEEIRKQLDEIRERGYAVSQGEVDPGVTGVAAPVFGPTDRVAAALGLAGPNFRIGEGRALEDAIGVIRSSATALSTRLAEVEG